ncbi:unnamed protein product [Pocillopora meandrina]|uniref:Uncharacterized protein n=1 Tax=Pocillopora meandrina TaxID=46732 RepID=A0AAU9WD62_9CNID|nr:unnamed protein product [Pocillopora meandrina]
MAAQEEERAKEQQENKPFMRVENSNNEEVEEVFEQTTESTGLSASLATAASPAEDCTRKQEESKPLPEASEADEGLGRTGDGADAGDNSADVAAQVEKRGSEGGGNQKTLHERLEIGNDESLTKKSGGPQDFPDCPATKNGTHRASSVGPFSEAMESTCLVNIDENIASETINGKAVPQNSQSWTSKLKDAESPHPKVTALDGTDIKCTTCGLIQMISKNCEKCKKSFADYYCSKCQLLISNQVDPYHCDECKTCRADEKNHFHCSTCNICMAKTLKDNHQCFPDRGHDPCAICLEEVFSGAIIFPCFHMVHKDCAISLVKSGSVRCPMCRRPIFQERKDNEETEPASSYTSFQWIRSRFSFGLLFIFRFIFETFSRPSPTIG